MKADTIKFIKEVARDEGIALTEKEAEKAYKILKQRANPKSADFYYAAKEYFIN